MFNKNPTIIINGISELIKQLLPLLVVVGLVQLGEKELAAWVIISGIVLSFISTTLLRSQVYSEHTTNKLIKEGIASGKGTTVEEVKEEVAAQNT